MNCARCHSHKFDPIPQRDYYRLMALFTPAYNPQHWKPVFPWKPEIKDRAIPDVSPAEQAEIERANLAVDRDVAAMQSRMSQPQMHAPAQSDAQTADRRALGRTAARSAASRPCTTSARPRRPTCSSAANSKRPAPKSSPAS